MSGNVHGTPRRTTLLWVSLIIATLATWSLGAAGMTGTWLIVLLAAISFWKGAVIILDFMALRRAPLLWPAVTLGWMVVVWGVIAIAYLRGMN